MEATDRLKILIRYLVKSGAVKSQKEMGQQMGYTNESSFSQVVNAKVPWPKSFGEKLKAVEPAVNIDWLLTGEGEMLRPASSGPSAPSAEVPHADEPRRVPLIPGVAKGGTLGEYADPVRRSDCGLIVTPVPAAELAITVSGESMEPDYPAGSVALLRRIDEASFIEWGRAYVLDTVNGAVLKLLAPSDREGHVRCLSINPSPAFAPFDVLLPDIHGIYRVLACIIFH